MFFQLKASKGLLFKTHYSVTTDESGLLVQDGNDALKIPTDDIINVYISFPYRPGETGLVVVDYFDENRRIKQCKLDDARLEGRLTSRIQALLEMEWAPIKNAKRMTPVRRWINMAAAPHYIATSGDISTFGGMVPIEQNQELKKAELLKKWHITGRAELYAMLEAMLDGYHARLFEKVKNDRQKLETIRSMENAFGDKAMLAWDLVNVIMLASCGYIAGYCSIIEASSWGLKAARKLQQSYTGWQEMYAAYLAGYLFCTDENINNKQSLASIQDEIIKQLLKSNTSPLKRVDWKASLRIDWETE
jgi:hypothetical protein